jgi:hypothetical protein
MPNCVSSTAAMAMSSANTAISVITIEVSAALNILKADITRQIYLFSISSIVHDLSESNY